MTDQPDEPGPAEPDPWVELTPGALCRLAIHEKPDRVAWDLLAWVGRRHAPELARWLRDVARYLDERPEAPSRWPRGATPPPDERPPLPEPAPAP